MSVLLDEETVVLESLDFEVRCVAPPESHKAEFSITCRACGGGELMCADHLLYFRNYLTKRRRMHVECRACKFQGPHLGGCGRGGAAMSETVDLTSSTDRSANSATSWSGDAALIRPEPWMQDARCAETDPDMFFPPVGDHSSTNAARTVCDACDVAAECLAFALRTEQRHGIWGGLTTRQRTALRRAS